ALDAGAEVGDLAVGDGQAGDGHARVAQGMEDALGVVTADGDAARTRPRDGQVSGDGQLAAAQGDRTAEAAGEVDGVAAGRGANLVPQGPGAAVEQVGDGQGAGDSTVFEAFQRRPEAMLPGRPVGLRGAARAAEEHTSNGTLPETPHEELLLRV